MKHKEIQEKEMIDKLFARSEDVFSDLEEAYGQLCKKLISQILNYDVEDMKECMNDVYLGVWNTIPPNRPNSLKAYICRIARNQAVKKLEYRTAKKRYETTISLQEELDGCLPAARNEYENVELAEIINQFLEKLDKESRMMFVRRYWYADSMEELAVHFRYSKNHISVKLGRIRKKLKKYLEAEGIWV